MTKVAPAHRLDALFRPAHVAVVGVSADPAAPGSRVFRNLRRTFDGARFGGTVSGVNRREPVVDGQQTVASVRQLDPVPELVVVATPAPAVEGVLVECAEQGVRAAVVLSAGFGEAGEEGRTAQRRITEVARAADIAMLGPNSMGLINRGHGMFATFTNAVEEPNPGGRVAVVGQSGGMAAIVYTILLSHGIGVNYLCALGNEAALSLGEAVDWMVRTDSGVDTVVGFVESLSGWDELAAAARTANRAGKVIALCRAGRSPAGATAAGSHVGAVAGDDTVLTQLSHAYGLHQARTLDDLVDVARARHVARPMRGPRVGVVTASGGAGSLLADLITAAGLALPELSDGLRQRVYEVIPWFGSATNPVDTTAYVQNRPEVFADVVDILCGSGELDAVMVFLGTLDPIADRLVAALRDAARRNPQVPVVAAWGGGSRRFKTALWQAGVATYDDPARAVAGLAGLWHAPLPAPAAPPTGTAPPPDDGVAVERFLPAGAERAVLGEHLVRDLLTAAGFPVVPGALVHSAEQAVKEADRLDGPVVLKLVATGLEHKSDAGGVVVGVRGEDEVRRHADRLLALADRLGVPPDGVLVEQQAPGGLELLCGFRRDPAVGPVVVVGLGGVLTEIVAQVAVRSAPLSVDEALDALGGLCEGRLLSHRRGIPEPARRPLAELLVRLGDLALRAPWIAELECNPLIVSGSDLFVCDGLATVVRTGDGTP